MLTWKKISSTRPLSIMSDAFKGSMYFCKDIYADKFFKDDIGDIGVHWECTYTNFELVKWLPSKSSI